MKTEKLILLSTEELEQRIDRVVAAMIIAGLMQPCLLIMLTFTT